VGAISKSLKPEFWRLEPADSGSNQARPQPAPLKDVWIRVILIPAFGIAIPNLTGYFGPLGPANPKYWVGLAWGILISFTIWHGNRYFLLLQRRHYDWFRNPVRKISALVFACVLCTTPCIVLMMLAWYAFAGFRPDWGVIRLITLACVICVAFITHVYETVYLIQQRESDIVAMERSERAKTQAELEALKAQIAPHFLFNCFNTLGWLIENNQAKAAAFNQNLAEVYRYILIAQRRELVPLEEEWRFLRQYGDLLELRFANCLTLALPDPGERAGLWHVPPLSLQTLFENAVKHNRHSQAEPLEITVRFAENTIFISNEKRPRANQEPSAGLGLKALDERCRLALGRGIEVSDEGARFTVCVPALVV